MMRLRAMGSCAMIVALTGCAASSGSPEPPNDQPKEEKATASTLVVPDGHVIEFVDAAKDDTLWLVTRESTFDGTGYGNRFRIARVGADFTERCATVAESPAPLGPDDVSAIFAVDPDGALVMADDDGDATTTRVVRHDPATCAATLWLRGKRDADNPLKCGCPERNGKGSMTATRHGVYFRSRWGDLDPVAMLSDGTGGASFVTLALPGSGPEIYHSFSRISDDEIALTYRAYGYLPTVTRFDAKTGDLIEHLVFKLAATSLSTTIVPVEGSYVVVRTALDEWTEAGWKALLFDVAGPAAAHDKSVAPWIGASFRVDNRSTWVAGFEPSTFAQLVTADAWIMGGGEATKGIGSSGLFASSNAALRIQTSPTAEPTMVRFEGSGDSDIAEVIRTTSGAMVLRIAFTGTLKVGDQTLGGSSAGARHALVRVGALGDFARLGGGSARTCAMHSAACVECLSEKVAPSTQRCFDREVDCVSRLSDAERCACGAQLEGLDAAAVESCFDTVRAVDTTGPVVVKGVLETCAAECR